MGQQHRLEHQHDEPQHRSVSRAKQNGGQAGARHVAAAACDGRELERRDDKNKRAGHRQQQQGFALRLHRAAQPDHTCRQERKAQRPPCRTVCRRKIPFHDVHGIGALRYKQNAAHDHGKRQKSLFTLGH